MTETQRSPAPLTPTSPRPTLAELHGLPANTPTGPRSFMRYDRRHSVLSALPVNRRPTAAAEPPSTPRILYCCRCTGNIAMSPVFGWNCGICRHASCKYCIVEDDNEMEMWPKEMDCYPRSNLCGVPSPETKKKSKSPKFGKRRKSYGKKKVVYPTWNRIAENVTLGT